MKEQARLFSKGPSKQPRCLGDVEDIHQFDLLLLAG